ncbi:hypothetical protein DUG83_23575 [Vibrio parahaemolyticus]|nr:hypothetical protein [Vibrio parahaemolyticus]
MDTINKSVLCDATPSWNGYNYQGKVGLYVCLENILLEARKGVGIDSFNAFLAEHHIEYEWIEDFAIKRNDSYLSLHQVKHKGENKFNDHIEAIATILYRKNGVLSDTDIFKYFTFQSRKKGDAAKAKACIKSELLAHNLIDDYGKINSNWNASIKDVDSNYSNGIEKCFVDFESLIKKAFSCSITYFHTAEKVEHPSVDIHDINGIPSHLVANLVNPKSLSCKDIFLSFDNQNKYDLALSDDELNHKLETQIGELLKLLHSEETFLEEDVKLYKTALCALVDQNLVKRHRHIRDKIDNDIPYLQRVKPSISFSDIVKELEGKIRKLDEQYWNLICRENFEQAYKDKLDGLYYLLSNNIIDNELYEQYQSNLETLRMDVIDQYLPNNCVDFLKKIYPHQTRSELQEHQFYNAISEPIKIKNVFLNFIQKVMKPSCELTLTCSKNTYLYQPTCIDFNESDELVKEIEINKAKKGLAENAGNQSVINRNVDFIVVNSTGEDDTFSAGIEKITEVISYDSKDFKMKESNKFTESKEIKFIDSRKALRKINE